MSWPAWLGAAVVRDDIVTEMREVGKDLLAFKQARDCLYGRVRELEDRPARRALLEDWPAFKVIDNGLIMAIVRCEGLIEDYRLALEKMDLPDNVVSLERKS